MSKTALSNGRATHKTETRNNGRQSKAERQAEDLRKFKTFRQLAGWPEPESLEYWLTTNAPKQYAKEDTIKVTIKLPPAQLIFMKAIAVQDGYDSLDDYATACVWAQIEATDQGTLFQ